MSGEWVLILYLWSGAFDQCNGRSDGGARCWKQGGSHSVTVAYFYDKKSCEDAVKPFYRLMQPKDYRSQGPDNVFHVCARR